MEKCIYIVLFLLGSLVLGSCEDDCSAVAEGDNQKSNTTVYCGHAGCPGAWDSF